MPVKDQQNGTATLVGESPSPPLVVGYVDGRRMVPRLHAHLVAPPALERPVLAHRTGLSSSAMLA
jgi:hypothetical protein